MAVCSLCNKDNIGFMNGFSMTGISGKVCNECHDNLLKMRSCGSDDTVKYFSDIIHTNSSLPNSDFLIKEIAAAQSSNGATSSDEMHNIANRLQEELDSVLLVTSDSIINRQIESYGNIVTGISVLGTGFFSELDASISDILGGNSSSFENKIAAAKNNAINMLKKEAYKIQCNAVIGVSVNFVPFSGNMIGLVVTGTAVKLSQMY